MLSTDPPPARHRVRPAATLCPVEAERVLTRCGGVATVHTLRAAGVGWRRLQRAIDNGSVRRVRPGVVAAPDTDPSVVAALALGGVLSCASAARHHGLPVLRPGAPHVCVPRGRPQPVHRGVVVHRRDLHPDEHDGLRTGLLRTALDCGRELSRPEAVVIMDAVMHAGLPDVEFLGAVARSRGPGSRALREAAACSDGRAESPTESLLRLIAAPLGALDLQVVVDGVGRVDMVLDGWLVLEADGYRFHSGRVAFQEDRRRANALATRGYLLLRFTWADVMDRPDSVRDVIRTALRRGAGATAHTMPDA